ncbi:cryptochrome/photolyase family protein [Streptomyces sp. NPDC057638]|uniref:cryptochrome/photolyase family protein n=1 Tax=Streptomyces sp. NPDC057638 TaxID=3346190 RepID=UPI00368D9A9E
MTVSVVLFTSDLRLHDHPPLRAALDRSDQVVPLFVQDSDVRAVGFDVPNRRAFLADCLADLDTGLRERGGRLVVRTGRVADEVAAVVGETGATEVHLAAGVSRYAALREERLRAALAERECALVVHDAVVTVVPPGAVTPSGSDHYAVFTPYFRRWSQERPRDPLAAPRRISVPAALAGDARDGTAPGAPARSGATAPALPPGGERAGRRRMSAWLRRGIDAYEERHDDLAGDATSRLSPYLHFGALSATELVHRARGRGGPGAEAFVRQLCWRDFHHQVLAARPESAADDYRDRGDHWRSGRAAEADIAAWKTGRTGYPLVDAAMRQLLHEGWMHNRGRLLAASFLTKTLYADWRVGARHFLDHLVDGDLANNQLNWQWAAGTGTDTRPNRVLNPVAQARRFDPDGAYVRRWVPELAGLTAPDIHQPWRLPEKERAALDYPEPLVSLTDGLARFQEARTRS